MYKESAILILNSSLFACRQLYLCHLDQAKREENQNVQIHDYFANLEAEDSGRERKIKHDKNLVSSNRVIRGVCLQ